MNDGVRIRLKKKYRAFYEPREWYDRAGHKNATMWSRTKSGNNQAARIKRFDHPIGMSGRGIGKMIHNARPVQKGVKEAR